VVLDQGHRQEGLVARLTLLVLPRPCANETLRLDDLAKDAPQPMIGTLRRAHAEAEGATRADVHLAERSREALRAPPAGQVLGLRPGFEDETARRIKDPRDDELPFFRLGSSVGSSVHASSPSFSARADNPPSGQGFAP